MGLVHVVKVKEKVLVVIFGDIMKINKNEQRMKKELNNYIETKAKTSV